MCGGSIGWSVLEIFTFAVVLQNTSPMGTVSLERKSLRKPSLWSPLRRRTSNFMC